MNRITPATALALGSTLGLGVAAFTPMESTVIKPATIELVSRSLWGD